MARHGFLTGMRALARESARLQRQVQAAQRRQLREQARQLRESPRLTNQLLKEQRQQYLSDRQNQAEEATTALQVRMEEVRSILEVGLESALCVSFTSLRQSESLPPFSPPPELASPGTAPKLEEFVARVRSPSLLEKILFMAGRFQRETEEQKRQFSQQQALYLTAEQERKKTLQKMEAEHVQETQRRLEEIRVHNAQVSALEEAHRNADSDAVINFFSMVLESSRYPDEGFPQHFRVAYVPAAKELIVDYELPLVAIVPNVAEYRYIKSKDVIEEKPRKITDIKDTYQDIVAAITLRTIHEIVSSDALDHLAVVVFNGFVNAIDPATGQAIKPYLVSLRVTKERFQQLELSRIDKKSCLRSLGAHVSSRAAELLPVKPLIEFDMIDKRFIEDGGPDVLSALESRPNLMDLTPFEFEVLVSTLFTKMGLETKQTRSSRDGGVDAVAYDMRPVIGGKVVIQAKRYRHTVGVSAVRDLFGTMNHEGANKGILVTTSSFGPDAYDFISGKPVELIDGGALLYYLEQAGIKARIVFPIEESSLT